MVGFDTGKHAILSNTIPTISRRPYRPDASLVEVAALVKTVFSAACKPGARLQFRTVYQETTGRFTYRDAGSIINGKQAPSDNRTLDDAHFQIGDFLDVAVYINGSAPPSASIPSSPRSGGRPYASRDDRDRDDHRGPRRPYYNDRNNRGRGRGGGGVSRWPDRRY